MIAAVRLQVMRTDKGKQLPVYTDFKNGRSRVVTSVRKVAGDVQVRAACSSFSAAVLGVYSFNPPWLAHRWHSRNFKKYAKVLRQHCTLGVSKSRAFGLALCAATCTDSAFELSRRVPQR